MPIGESPYTTQQVGTLCRIPIQKTTARIRRLQDRLELIAAGFRTRHPRTRPDNLTTMIVATIVTGGRLAEGDPRRFRRFVRQIVDQSVRFPPA